MIVFATIDNLESFKEYFNCFFTLIVYDLPFYIIR